MTLINFKIIIFIFILLSSCSSRNLNKYSDKTNSTQMKTDEIRLNQNKINKEKLENLYIANKPNQSVVFEFRKESILREFKTKRLK